MLKMKTGRTAFKKHYLWGHFLRFHSTFKQYKPQKICFCFAFISILTCYCRILLSSCAGLMMSILFCNKLFHLFSKFHQIHRKIQSLNYTCSKLEMFYSSINSPGHPEQYLIPLKSTIFFHVAGTIKSKNLAERYRQT